MNVLNVEGVSKSYGIRTLFKDINLTITDESKMGLIGINGTGKSTLLRVIAGTENPDEGQVSTMKGIRIEFLSQNPEFKEGGTILEQVFHGDSQEISIIRAYEKALEQVTEEPDNLEAQTALLKWTEDMKRFDLWDYESQAKTILTKLGVQDFHRKIENLSGGQRKRVALAKALISPCDLLILDEPTNHMDNSTIDWLENLLKQRKGALLMITHDRYFLDRIVNQTLELHQGNLYAYSGNYTEFISKKLERQDQLVAFEKKRQNLYRTELKWIRRGVQGRGTKQKSRIQRFEALKDAKVDLRDDELIVSIKGSRLGNKIIEMNQLGKAFGSLKVLDDFSYMLLRDDRIGIIGDNGMGKSSLLKMIVGDLEPDKGLVDTGQTVKIGYFSQESESMDLSMTAINYIKETAEYTTTIHGKYLSAAQLMETFLFTSEMQHTVIERLSGGEKRRLFLLKVLMEEPNILILDEPTNDLDIDTLKVLENYMDTFEGPVITVSHDRYFLDRTCDKIFAFSAGGVVEQFPGNYTDYIHRVGVDQSSNLRKANTSVQMSNDEVSLQEPDGKTNVGKKLSGEQSTSPSMDSTTNESKPKKKLSYNEQREYDTIHEDIDQLEHKMEDLSNQLEQNTSNYTLLQELQEALEEVEMELLDKMERLEYFESIVGQKN